jgi:hypothetical protein
MDIRTSQKFSLLENGERPNIVASNCYTFGLNQCPRFASGNGTHMPTFTLSKGGSSPVAAGKHNGRFYRLL